MEVVMVNRLNVVSVLLVLLLVGPVSVQANESSAAVEKILDSLHLAASEADGEVYFKLFTEDAVYMGTDVNERWSIAEFKSYAEPYFSEGRGWTYLVRERHVYLAEDGATAWFDEILWNEAYGTCRGTGVLVLTSGGWRIAQYHLTFPIPNELARDFTSRIKEHEASAKK
jgi:hypothetical protein